jgi:predicted enzyme related to lactoylglutathione lyase
VVALAVNRRTIMRLNSLDVGARDMRRALGFYRRLFSAEPIDVGAGCALFDVGAVSFGIISTAQVEGELRFGNNCVPNFQVDDIDAEYGRILEIAPRIDDRIRCIGNYRYFQFTDTEGNLVEVYAVPDI